MLAFRSGKEAAACRLPVVCGPSSNCATKCPVTVSSRQILRRRLDRLTERGLAAFVGTGRIEHLLRRIRNGLAGAGLYMESAKGECNLGQHEIEFATAERHATALLTADTRTERSGAPITCGIITVAPVGEADPTQDLSSHHV